MHLILQAIIFKAFLRTLTSLLNTLFFYPKSRLTNIIINKIFLFIHQNTSVNISNLLPVIPLHLLSIFNLFKTTDYIYYRVATRFFKNFSRFSKFLPGF